MEIGDAHQHVGALTAAMPRSSHPTGAEVDVETDAAWRIGAMDALEIDWALLQPGHGYLRADGIADTRRVNDRMAQYRKIAPDRFRAIVGTVEPLHGERSIAEIDRCKHELGLDGLSWHHRFSGCFIDSPWMWPFLERMAELDLTPVIHVNAESNLEAHWRLQRLAKDFPHLSFLAHDGLWTYERASQVLESARETPNIVWDFGGPVNYLGVSEWVNRNGADTICFSAGLAYGGRAQSKPPLLSMVEQAAISDADKAAILSGNLRRLFRC